MLTIKRVATVLSNYQEDAYEKQEAGCGRNCLGKCCLPASTLPLYAFKKDQEDSGEYWVINSSKEQPQLLFLNLLLGQWENRMKQGLFRYDLMNCKTKIIPGKYGFIAHKFNDKNHNYPFYIFYIFFIFGLIIYFQLVRKETGKLRLFIFDHDYEEEP